MFGQFMQNIRSRCNRVRTQIQLQTRFLCSRHQTVCRRFITVDIHVFSRLFLCLARHGIAHRYRSMGILTKMITVVKYLHIGFGNFRFLGKFLAQNFFAHLHIAMEQPAYQSQSKHVLCSQDRLVVQPAVFQAFLTHGSDSCRHDFILDTQFREGIFQRKLSLFQVTFGKRIGVDNNYRLRFTKFILCFQGCRIHGYQHIALIARSIYLSGTNMHLKARHTSQ